MADLKVSYDYLDDLEATLVDVAGLIGGDDLGTADHSVSGSATVGAAGNEVASFQISLSALLAENVTTMAASVGQAATSLAEADARLSDQAGRPVNPGAY
jgi:hypothetical protein